MPPLVLPEAHAAPVLLVAHAARALEEEDVSQTCAHMMIRYGDSQFVLPCVPEVIVVALLLLCFWCCYWVRRCCSKRSYIRLRDEQLKPSERRQQRPRSPPPRSPPPRSPPKAVRPITPEKPPTPQQPAPLVPHRPMIPAFTGVLKPGFSGVLSPGFDKRYSPLSAKKASKPKGERWQDAAGANVAGKSGNFRIKPSTPEFGVVVRGADGKLKVRPEASGVPTLAKLCGSGGDGSTATPKSSARSKGTPRTTSKPLEAYTLPNLLPGSNDYPYAAALFGCPGAPTKDSSEMGIGGAGWASHRSGSSTFRETAAEWRTPRGRIDNSDLHSQLVATRSGNATVANRLTTANETLRKVLRDKGRLERGGAPWSPTSSFRESARKLKDSIKAKGRGLISKR